MLHPRIFGMESLLHFIYLAIDLTGLTFPKPVELVRTNSYKCILTDRRRGCRMKFLH